jgi:hypothetical protein
MLKMSIGDHVDTVPTKHLFIQGQITLIWYSKKEYSIKRAENKETLQN